MKVFLSSIAQDAGARISAGLFGLPQGVGPDPHRVEKIFRATSPLCNPFRAKGFGGGLIQRRRFAGPRLFYFTLSA